MFFLKGGATYGWTYPYHLYLPMGRSAKDEYREASSSHSQDLQVFKMCTLLLKYIILVFNQALWI